MMPQYPQQIITQPFANKGNIRVIPDGKQVQGQASYAEGFPVETQLPLSNGGIAPSRLDFNGILNVLSALGFWQQSGGQMIYKATLDYTRPSVVHSNGRLWWCVADNGPDAINGVVAPGTNANVWMDFMDFLTTGDGSAGSSRPGGSAVRPVGELIHFYGSTAPDGFLACDGSGFSATTYPQLAAFLGAAVTPDLRGVVLRGLDPTGLRDPDGPLRNPGSYQGDAMRNLQGSFTSSEGVAEGVFTMVGGKSRQVGTLPWSGNDVNFDASLQVPVAPEFRMKNISVLICIKHD